LVICNFKNRDRILLYYYMKLCGWKTKIFPKFNKSGWDRQLLDVYKFEWDLAQSSICGCITLVVVANASLFEIWNKNHWVETTQYDFVNNAWERDT
jgi:hypothetical protein